MDATVLNQKILEARFAQLILSIQEAVLVENEDRKIILVNEQFCKMFANGAPPEALIGMDCANAAEESKGFFKNPEIFVAGITEILEKRELVLNDQLEMVNGTFLERDYIPVFLDNKYLGHMWKYRDVTQKIKMVHELMDAKASVDQKNRELEKFAYVVSHDLKAPLRGISTLAEWVKEDISQNDPNEAFKKLNLIQRRAIRMNNLIHGILEYSRAGLQNIGREWFNLNEMVEQVIMDFQENEGVRINCEMDIPSVFARKVPLTQVFSNLISNAIKHNDKEEICINISSRETSNFIEFVIEDNGPGIPEGMEDKIFEIFQVLVSRDIAENTGVGLSIVKRIITEEGGAIRAESTLGEGTKMTFSIQKKLEEYQAAG